MCGELRGPTCVLQTYDTPCHITAFTAWQDLGKSLQHAAHMVDIQEYPVQGKLHMAIHTQMQHM